MITDRIRPKNCMSCSKVMYPILSPPLDAEGRKELFAPFDEYRKQATATVMVYPKGSEEPRLLYHNPLWHVKFFFLMFFKKIGDVCNL